MPKCSVRTVLVVFLDFRRNQLLTGQGQHNSFQVEGVVGSIERSLKQGPRPPEESVSRKQPKGGHLPRIHVCRRNSGSLVQTQKVLPNPVRGDCLHVFLHRPRGTASHMYHLLEGFPRRSALRPPRWWQTSSVPKLDPDSGNLKEL